MVLARSMLPSAWVVDSNCFIHLGSHGYPELVKDLASACKQMGAQLHVTPGVHDEVSTVRMQKWKGKPRLLDAMKEILVTTSIPGDQVKGLAQRIGENASPQDVDLSLMVLATRMAGSGEEVVLVSDDYKMTTTGQRVHLPFKTCPPSTFIQRLSELGPKSTRPRLRSLSRKVRSEEMRYAISRAGQYDVQSKLTWMIDSLLQSKVPPPIPESAPDDSSLVTALRRHMAGERVKKSRLNALGSLTEICAPVQELLATPREELASALEVTMVNLGIGLAPVKEELGAIAHRAVAPILSRVEAALGLMAKEAGDHATARRNLVRSLHHATLVDDDEAEMNALFHLGLADLASDKFQRSAELFEAAAAEAARLKSSETRMVLAAAIARQLEGTEDAASKHVSHAHSLVEGNESEAAVELEKLGESLLAIGRPVLAIEVLDEALECATEVGDVELSIRLTESIARSQAAVTGDDEIQLQRMRSLLDKVNSIGGAAAENFAAELQALEERKAWQEEPLDEVWNDWQPSTALIPQGSLEVLRGVKQDDSMLLICYSPDLGNLGLWLPDSDIEANDASRHEIIISSRVKVAHPPEALKNEHKVRGIVALEDVSSLTIKPVESTRD